MASACAAAVVGLCLVAACTRTEPQTAAPEAPAALVAAQGELAQDFGILRAGSLAEMAFALENISDGGVALKVLMTSCPCVTVDISPPTIEAGERAQVTVLTEVPAGEGFQEYTLMIKASPAVPEADGDKPRVQRVTASIAFRAERAPEELGAPTAPEPDG